MYERWLELARDDDFVGVQNYERIHYDGSGAVPLPPDVPANQMGSAIEPLSLAGAVRYAYESAGVPVLVTEHGMSTDDDSLRAAFLEPSLAGLLDVIEDGVPVWLLHWTLMDNFEWVFGYGLRSACTALTARRSSVHPQAERWRLLGHRPQLHADLIDSATLCSPRLLQQRPARESCRSS